MTEDKKKRRELSPDGCLEVISCSSENANETKSKLIVIEVNRELLEPSEIPFQIASLHQTSEDERCWGDDHLDNLIPGLRKCSIINRRSVEKPRNKITYDNKSSDQSPFKKPVYQESFKRPISRPYHHRGARHNRSSLFTNKFNDSRKLNGNFDNIDDFNEYKAPRNSKKNFKDMRNNRQKMFINGRNSIQKFNNDSRRDVSPSQKKFRNTRNNAGEKFNGVGNSAKNFNSEKNLNKIIDARNKLPPAQDIEPWVQKPWEVQLQELGTNMSVGVTLPVGQSNVFEKQCPLNTLTHFSRPRIPLNSDAENGLIEAWPGESSFNNNAWPHLNDNYPSNARNSYQKYEPKQTKRPLLETPPSEPLYPIRNPRVDDIYGDLQTNDSSREDPDDNLYGGYNGSSYHNGINKDDSACYRLNGTSYQEKTEKIFSKSFPNNVYQLNGSAGNSGLCDNFGNNLTDLNINNNQRGLWPTDHRYFQRGKFRGRSNYRFRGRRP